MSPANFDPNAIPNFDRDGRVGESDRNQPEQRQSSAQATESADQDATLDEGEVRTRDHTLRKGLAAGRDDAPSPERRQD